MAANKISNKFNTIGYQGFVVSDQFYYFHYPTKFEKKINSLPKKIAIISKNKKNNFKIH